MARVPPHCGPLNNPMHILKILNVTCNALPLVSMSDKTQKLMIPGPEFRLGQGSIFTLLRGVKKEARGILGQRAAMMGTVSQDGEDEFTANLA